MGDIAFLPTIAKFYFFEAIRRVGKAGMRTMFLNLLIANERGKDSLKIITLFLVLSLPQFQKMLLKNSFLFRIIIGKFRAGLIFG